MWLVFLPSVDVFVDISQIILLNICENISMVIRRGNFKYVGHSKVI
jgi:hypothetical protein